MRRQGRLTGLFDSLGFYIAMSMVSVFVITECTLSLWKTGEFSQGGLRLIIWLVIGYHFIQRAFVCWKVHQQ